LPWPLRSILGWRAAAVQAAAEKLIQRLPKLVVERFSAPLSHDLFASETGSTPNPRAHSLWAEQIAALALPLIAESSRRIERRPSDTVQPPTIWRHVPSAP
jgi:hypothetical protein